MAEMIVVKCDIGSKAATVLCPSCARISRQILKAAFNNGSNNELLTAHTCPVCGAVYHVCNSFGADAWKAAFSRYTMSPDSYNEAVKENHNRKKQAAIDAQRAAEQKPEPVPAPAPVEANPQNVVAPVNKDGSQAEDGKSEALDSVASTLRQVAEQREVQEEKTAVDTINESAFEPDNNASAGSDDASSSSTDPVQVLMERKMDRWKKELLDTGKRNKMINYRESKRQTLKILEPSATELFNQLAISEKTLTFQRPISKDSDFRTYSMLALLETLSYSLPVHVGDIKAEGTVMEREKTLKNLRAKTRLAQEEQGTNILYLSFGFILWREHNRDSSPWLKSPLLMMPVQLGLKSLNAPYTISKYDDEIEVNPTLDYLFNQDYGIDLPTFELKNKDSFENYLEQIEEIIDKKGWKLVREVSLGLLSFLKISMYHDLNNNREQMMNNPVIQAISGDRHALGELPAEAHHFNFDKTQPTEWYEVVDSDSSQEEAILLSKLGVSFVMQGPPGTGKSQTITNIIAEALGDGKKVLFVSEKSAALQVVLKRLTDARLDDFCLSLHNYKANKKEIIDNIGANLRLNRGYVDGSVMGELTELFHDRQYLDEYADDLHKKIEPFGESVYMVFGKFARLSDATAVEFKIQNPTKITKEEYASLLYLVDAFEKAANNMDGELTANPWAGTTATSSGQLFKSEMVSATDGMPEQLNRLEASVMAFNSEYATTLGVSLEECAKGVQSMWTVFDLPLFPYEWRDAEKRRFLREKALREEQIDKDERNHALALTGLIEKVESGWNADKLSFSSKKMTDLFADRSQWVGEDKPESMAECSRIATAALKETVGTIEELTGNYEKAKALLHLDKKDDAPSIMMVSRVLSLLVDAPVMAPEWFDVRKNPEYYAVIAEVRNHRDIVKNKTDRLLEAWEPGVLSIDADGMLARFKTEYTGVLHKFKGNYKEDIRQIKLLSKTVGIQIGETEVIALLQQIGDINNEKKWFSDNEERLKATFPNHYQGENTDWDKVTTGIQKAAEIANQFPYANIPPEVITAILEIENSIQYAAEVRRLADLLGENNVNESIRKIRNAGVLRDATDEVSLSDVVLPKVKERIESESRYQSAITELDTAKKEGATSYAELDSLASDVSKFMEEGQWFRNNIPDIATELNLGEPDENEPIRALIDRARLIIKNHDAIAEKDETEELTGFFGNRYTGNDTDWQAIIRDLDAVDQYEQAGVPEEIDGFIRSVSEDAEKRETAKKKAEELKTLLEEVSPKLEYFDALFPKSRMKTMAFHAVAEKYNRCLNGFGELNKWLDFVEIKKECDEKGLEDFTDKIVRRNNSVRDVRKAFERGFYMQWLSLAIDDVPSVQTFRRRVHEQRLGKFVKLDEKQFEISKERIRDRIISNFPSRNGVTRARSELGILQHEMEKKRKIMPLRKLFHEIPTLLLTLKPCLMMSPLSVAYFLNAEDYHFDMVIFDEASQIFPQDAIGAIFRADQAIIAGDTRQLPPTNFFSASTSNGNDDYDDDNEEDFEDEVYDSILEETANVLPNRTLLWHYRSKHEHLIAFSNQEIYKNELVTFPSSNESEPDTGVEFSFVEGGYYERGTKRNNILEAKRCVELVEDHIKKNPDRSLGIIAFSEAQQQTILNEIQKFREANPKYEEFFGEDKEEAFFVKNLENVQGDERDTIILSICYARTKDQIANNKPMAMNFGPVMKAGGERRLNVAITRAKINVKLVSSILPSDIDLSRTTSDGIRMIRSYIEFAMNGGATLASANQSRVPDDFANAIYKFICDKGYKAKQYVGCSGYRIDIAVEHPEMKDEFVAGIECDGLSYAHAKTARDRDRLRGAVLKNMGWNLYRVWSTEWYRNPEVEGQKLVEFIDRAVSKTDERLQSVREQKEAEERKRQAEAENERQAKEREEKRRQLEEQRLAEAEKAKAEQAAERRRKAAEERRQAEAKRQEEDRLKAQREAEERRRREEAERQREQRTAMSQAGWAKPGVKVQHTAFGVGTIKEIEDKYVTVVFSAGEKRFALPNAFSKGFLKKADGAATQTQQRRSTTDTHGTHQMTLDEMMKGNTSKGGLYGDLVSAGFTCIDNRSSSAIIWVLYQADMKAEFEEIATKYHAQYKLEKRGAMATGGKAAWRIMT